MGYSIPCNFGGTIININANTKVFTECRRTEKLKPFANAHWNILPCPAIDEFKPEQYVPKPLVDVPFDADMWEQLCKTLNGIRRNISIWFDIINDELFELLYKFVEKDIDIIIPWAEWYDDKKTEKASLYNYEFELNPNERTITISSIYRYEYKVEKTRMDGEEYKESEHIDENKTYTLSFSNDFLSLLEALHEYYVKVTAPRKQLFSKELKSPKIHKDTIRIQEFFEKFDSSIQQFKKCAIPNRTIEETNRIAYEKAEQSKEKKGHDYKISVSEWEKSLPEDYKKFIEKASHIVLEVDGKVFCKDYCGFDIYQKEQEVLKIIEKLQGDPGENDVEYALKWYLAEAKHKITAIKKDCESKHRYGCIMLKNSAYIDEAQEYDHILVFDGGVIVIETKNWNGHIEIRSDGRWIKHIEDEKIVGVENPVSQIKRHEKIINSILPNVPIFNLLCFSNKSVILDGTENFTAYPIVYLDQLVDTISHIIDTSDKAPNSSIEYIVKTIEKYKVNKINA